MPIRLPLHTDRLEIRPFVLADRAAMQPIYDDPEVMRHITGGGDPRGWVASYVRDQRTRGFTFWAVVERATGDIIGEAGLAPFDDGRRVELGYLLRRDRWGRGLATEAARAILDAAFTDLGAREVMAVVDEGNDASLNVLRKLGFSEVGRRRRHGVRQHVLRASGQRRRPNAK
ncbi:MAG: GNAT family N-acetyltransferase [Solirubrobacteraceae bacterium]